MKSEGRHTGGAMDRNLDTNAVVKTAPPTAHLPPELRQHIILHAAPEDVVFGLRLSCREESLCYPELVHRTAPLSRPLPGHVVDTAWCLAGAQAAMRQLTFHQKLRTLSTAAASGCEANVEFAWQLLQPHVFPELLRTQWYQKHAHELSSHRRPDLGSAAVSSGLAHLLPSLAQRCPGLLNPGATLKAAARHCDLAGLQAAWGAVGQLLQGFTQQGHETTWGMWNGVLCAAARSETADSIDKMAWVLGQAGAYLPTVLPPTVCGAAAASGDLSRPAWLRDRGFPWGTVEALAAVMCQADLGFIQRLEQEGGYLPPAEDVEAWASEGVVAAAAASARDDGLDKLTWLAGRGAALGSRSALFAAVMSGKLEAAQLLAGQVAQGPAGGDAEGYALIFLQFAVMSGNVPLVAWLPQAGYPLCHGRYVNAFQRGDLPMVRWLLQAGCPRGPDDSLVRAVELWPCHKPVDSGRLVEVVRLLAAEGWPAGRGCLAAAVVRHPGTVVVALRELLPDSMLGWTEYASPAATSGCEAALEVLAGMGVLQEHGAGLGQQWYVDAAAKGDRGTLECLRRLGVPLGKGVLAAAIRQSAPVPALQWLVQQGAPRGGAERALRGELPQRREEVAAWLRGLPRP